MNDPLVSIIIPHFQTPDLVRLCLRSIRRYTRNVPYEVIVVDNGSQDRESLEYLRQVEWIRLIERTENIGRLGLGHKEAIDIGIDAGVAPYVLAFHTDTIPIHEDWLSWHLEQIDANQTTAAVGTYKLELKSSLQILLKNFDHLRWWKKRSAQDIGDHRPYIRSHCALYRRDVLEKLGLNYNDPDDDVAGRYFHYALEKNGYEAKLLDVAKTLKRVVHLNHGTMVVIPELGARRRTIRKGLKRIEQFVASSAVQAVFNDDSLDRGLTTQLLRAA